MSIRCTYIDWRQPALKAAVEYLRHRAAHEGEWELSGYVVAFPGSFAARRFLELLVDRARELKLPLTPPTCLTVGELPELLYQAKRPFANAFTQELAWLEALRQTPDEQRARLCAAPPAADDLPGWLSMAEMLSRLHTELAADTLNFHDVCRLADGLETFQEHARWQALAAIQDRYLRILDGLELWDRQTARLYAIDHRECQTQQQIVLVGAEDMNRAQRAMLGQVAERVAALVFAPPELSDRFDASGCLAPAAWQEATIALADDQVEVADNPDSQADAVCRAVASFKGRFATDEVTLGIVDEALVPYIQTRLEETGLSGRYGAGVPLTQSGPYRLLEFAAACLKRNLYADYAALVRHPDMSRWLDARPVGRGWLAAVDQYHADHLPLQAPAAWLGSGPYVDLARSAFQAAQQWLAPLRETARELRDWFGPIAQLLVDMYSSADSAPDRQTQEACETLLEAAQSWLQAPRELSPVVTGAEALWLLGRDVAAATIPPPANPQAVELLGWLELPLDDSPALIVSGFNEGLVPKAQNGDLFLPNELRRQLELLDNDRRYARDAYALSLLAASRRELRLIAGRRTAANDPMLPSRLLMATPDEELAPRVQSLFHPPASPRRRPWPHLPPSQTFDVPRPLPLSAPVTSMRVTEFRDYLACPYRYYLRYCLKLSATSDASEELDAAAFGTLLHQVLESFGLDPLRDSTDRVAIAEFLSAQLDARVAERFGDRPLAAVGVQVEQLRLRLHAFADWQVAWREQGWSIEHVELRFEGESVPMPVDGQPLYLRGRIDRIDRHIDGRRVVLDYKSGDKPQEPAETHRTKAGEWVDLQLPLYRRLAASLGLEQPMQLGYIVLPRSLALTGERLVEWSEAELAEADRVAAEVVRNVRRQEFWPPASSAPAFSDDLAAICRDAQLQAVLVDDDEEESL